MRAVCSLFVVVCFGFVGSAAGTSYVLVSDRGLADSAEVVARVKVEEGRVGLASGSIATEYTAVVEELVTGELGGSRVVIRVPGGVSEELGRAVVLWGVPRFEPGERALVFLRGNGDGSYRIVHLLQGVFRESPGGGERLWVRALSEEQWTLEAGSLRTQSVEDPARREQPFFAWLRDRAAGLERQPDYFTERPARFDAAYTRLSDSANLRWFVFDKGGKVRWHRHRDGQPGLTASQTAAAFRAARKAWRRQTGLGRLRLTDAGTTGSTGGFRRSDFRNTILFDDRNEIIGEDFDCDEGGVIAVGGASATLFANREWKEEFFFPIDEAEIVVNDGVACLFEGAPENAEQVYAHELGHTLGLGHSCGDGASPNCGRSAVLDEALMRAFYHDDGRGATLREDDLAGIWSLYDRRFFAAPCDRPPGHPRFCQRCGPCGEGQGACRKNSHCRYPLTCRAGFGEDFGFSAETKVCLP